MTASLLSIRTVEVVAADHRRDLLAQAGVEAARRAKRQGARLRLPARSRPEARPCLPGAEAVFGLPGRIGTERAVIDLCPPVAREAAGEHPSEERPVPSARW